MGGAAMPATRTPQATRELGGQGEPLCTHLHPQGAATPGRFWSLRRKVGKDAGASHQK